jgi:polyferredoxin
VFRPRVLVYTGVLLLIAAAFVASLAVRSPFRADVVRDRGVLARQVGEGQIENVYRIQLMNATESAQHFRIEVDGLPDATIDAYRDIDLPPTQARWVPVSVRIGPQAAQSLGSGAHPMRFRIALQENGRTRAEISEKSTFVVPR